MALRPYLPDDLDAVVEIWADASAIAHHFLPASFLDHEREEIATVWMPNAETIVAAADDGLDGFLSLVGDEVGGIFVRPEAQGRGVGRALLDEARRRRDHLELTVFEKNDRARRFYATYGFVESGRGVHPETGESEIHLRLG